MLLHIGEFGAAQASLLGPCTFLKWGTYAITCSPPTIRSNSVAQSAPPTCDHPSAAVHSRVATHDNGISQLLRPLSAFVRDAAHHDFIQLFVLPISFIILFFRLYSCLGCASLVSLWKRVSPASPLRQFDVPSLPSNPHILKHNCPSPPMTLNSCSLVTPRLLVCPGGFSCPRFPHYLLP